MLRGGFLATSVDTEETLAAIRSVHETFGYVLDPHTAVGYAAARKLADHVSAPLICIATAHPAKFPEAVRQALPNVEVRHPTLDALAGQPERKQVIEADIEAVKGLIAGTLGAS